MELFETEEKVANRHNFTYVRTYYIIVSISRLFFLLFVNGIGGTEVACFISNLIDREISRATACFITRVPGLYRSELRDGKEESVEDEICHCRTIKYYSSDTSGNLTQQEDKVDGIL